METIKAYLDNMFAALPKTGEVMKLKSDLLANMEEKYNELKASGKSENEAVGIVISEFGNIEELAGELGVSLERNEGEGEKTYVSDEAADEFLVKNKKSALMISAGVLMCILSPAALIWLAMLSSVDNAPISDKSAVLGGLIALFVLIAAAVGLFIGSGTMSEKFAFMKSTEINLDSSTRMRIAALRDQSSGKYTAALISSICMFILSPVLLIANALIYGDNELEATMPVCYGVVILLIICSVAAFILIYSATIKSGYDMLLGLEEYSPSQRKTSKLTDAIGGIFWPIIVVAYLASSFATERWDVTWIIWPAAGILFGAVCAIINAVSENKNKN